MTDATNTAASGWYPDPNAPGGQRWWDGTQWTDHVGQQAQPYQPFEEPKAPAGTTTGTVWIWLIVLLPLLGILPLFSIDIVGYMRSVLQNPSSPSSMLALYTSPGFLIATLGGWVLTAVTIVFAYLDWRTLKARGVPSPFHWGFAFLALAGFGIVYPIGRSVVVKRRTGGGLAPLWVAIAVYVVTFLVAIGWTIWLTNEIFAMMPSYVSS